MWLAEVAEFKSGMNLTRYFVQCIIGIMMPELAVVFGSDARAFQMMNVSFDKPFNDESDGFSILGDCS